MRNEWLFICTRTCMWIEIEIEIYTEQCAMIGLEPFMCQSCSLGMELVAREGYLWMHVQCARIFI